MVARRGNVRIIGGEHKGRRLSFVDQSGDLRPSSDRMRETLFNWLQGEIGERRVLDLFAGSGVLGAEALSRGASSAVLVERKRARAGDLSRQLKPLFGERIRVYHADAVTWLERASQHFDLVFIDPPYDLGLVTPACQALVQNDLLAPGALIYVESRRQSTPPEVPCAWLLHRETTGGDALGQLYCLPAHV